MKFCDACTAGCPSDHTHCWRCGKQLSDSTNSNHITAQTEIREAHAPEAMKHELCPDCKVGKMVNGEGCATCQTCGYSLCGS